MTQKLEKVESIVMIDAFTKPQLTWEANLTMAKVKSQNKQ